jgi:hypothetical protein
VRHLLENAFLVSGVAFHRLDEIGHEIVALLELHIDVGEGLFAPLPQGDEAVVDADEPENEENKNAENDPAAHEKLPLIAVSDCQRSEARCPWARRKAFMWNCAWAGVWM